MHQGFAGLPPALNYLASIDQLIVKQKKELLEGKFIKLSFWQILSFEGGFCHMIIWYQISWSQQSLGPENKFVLFSHFQHILSDLWYLYIHVCLRLMWKWTFGHVRTTYQSLSFFIFRFPSLLVFAKPIRVFTLRFLDSSVHRLHVKEEDSDQAARMRRLLLAFSFHTWCKVPFLRR